MGIDLKNIKAGTSEKSVKGKNEKSFLDFLNTDISFSKKKLKNSEKLVFFSELAMLLSSGIDLKTSLEIIVEEQTKPVIKELFEKIKENVIGGKPLSDSLKKSGYFSNYDFYSIKIGEESGKVIEVLNELNRFYSKNINQKRKITSALTYPSIVLLTAFAAIFFIMKFMVPMFVEIFARSNNQLPPLTKFIINTSSFFSKYYFIFIVLIVAIVLLNIIFRNNHDYRIRKAQLLIRLPIIGKLIKLFYLERFFQSMALLIGSKVNLLKAIELGRDMVDFPLLDGILNTVQADLLKGKLLNESLGKFSLFNKRTIYLIKVGEEVNQLDNVFKNLNNQYSEEFNYNIEILTNLLEPFLIIFVGVFVAIILIAMYLPMFQMGTNIF